MLFINFVHHNIKNLLFKKTQCQWPALMLGNWKPTMCGFFRYLHTCVMHACTDMHIYTNKNKSRIFSPLKISIAHIEKENSHVSYKSNPQRCYFNLLQDSAKTSKKQLESLKWFLNDKLSLFGFQLQARLFIIHFMYFVHLGAQFFSLNLTVDFLNYVFAIIFVVILPTTLHW